MSACLCSRLTSYTAARNISISFKTDYFSILIASIMPTTVISWDAKFPAVRSEEIGVAENSSSGLHGHRLVHPCYLLVWCPLKRWAYCPIESQLINLSTDCYVTCLCYGNKQLERSLHIKEQRIPHTYTCTQIDARLDSLTSHSSRNQLM